MSKTITGKVFLRYSPKNSYQPYTLSTYVMADDIELASIEVSLDIPEDFDETNTHIDALKAEKTRLYAEAQIKCNNIEEQIQSLLSIEHKES